MDNDDKQTPADLSFLAPAGEVADWRLTVLVAAAAEAGLLDRLPGTPQDIAARGGLDAHGVAVVLQGLTAFAVVERTPEGSYRRGAAWPGPDVVAVLRHHARALRQWSNALDDRLRGAPHTSDGRPPFNPAQFIDALGVGARRSAPSMVDTCLAGVPGARRVLDLGGGHGEYALEFARRGMATTLQDQPAMIEVVESRGQLAGAGVELFAGDFFERLPPGPFDLVFCAGVTHTFSAERNRSLYPRLLPLLSDAGRLAIVTFLRGRTATADLFAVQMLANGSGGDTHSEADYRAWLDEAGFSLIEVIAADDRPQSVLFAAPANDTTSP